MNWFKRFSNGVLALIIVGIIVVLSFAIILPFGIRISKYGNIAANRWTAAFKNPPEVVYEQLSRPTELYGVTCNAGDVIVTVKCKKDYKEVRVTVTLYEEGTDNIITFNSTDGNGNPIVEQATKIYTKSNIGKGKNWIFSYPVDPQILENYDVYEIACNVTYYK